MGIFSSIQNFFIQMSGYLGPILTKIGILLTPFVFYIAIERHKQSKNRAKIDEQSLKIYLYLSSHINPSEYSDSAYYNIKKIIESMENRPYIHRSISNLFYQIDLINLALKKEMNLKQKNELAKKRDEMYIDLYFMINTEYDNIRKRLGFPSNGSIHGYSISFGSTSAKILISAYLVIAILVPILSFTNRYIELVELTFISIIVVLFPLLIYGINKRQIIREIKKNK